MDRKEFLKGIGLMGIAATGASFFACSGDNDLLNSDSSSTSGSSGNSDVTSTSSECAVTNSETAGPFPTNNPEDLERVDITGDRTGVDLAINIVVRDVKIIAVWLNTSIRWARNSLTETLSTCISG